MVCQLDTGASCNVISYRDLSILLQNGTFKVEKSSVKLKMYDGSIMQPIGETVLKVKHNDSYHTLKFQVVDSPNKPLLSAESCEMLGLLQFNLNIPQNVHVVERTPKPPLSKDAILNTFKDVLKDWVTLVTPHLWLMRQWNQYNTHQDLFLSSYEMKWKKSYWILRRKASSRRSLLLPNG